MIEPIFQTKILNKKKDYAEFVLEPLAQGYGQTMGNSLRRCLLTSIPGAAITKIKIDGVQHQFSTLKGLKEDIIELILNIKQIRIAYGDEKEVEMSLDVKGPGEVKAVKIKTPAGVEIVNKDLKIGELANKNSHLKIKFWVTTGYGYSSAEERKSNTLGVIPVDAIFSPVIKVNYKVEATRVGQKTDLDKLILKLWSDGTIAPEKAFKNAAKILTGFFQQVYKPMVKKEKGEAKKEKINEFLDLMVEELNLPTRVANALRRGGYPTVKSLSEIKREDLNKVKNLGIKSINIIINVLKEKGIILKENEA